MSGGAASAGARAGARGLTCVATGTCSASESAEDEEDNTKSNDKRKTKYRCKGLRKQLEEHRKKLSDYISEPYDSDNLDVLRNNPDRYESIYNGRVRNLENQIKNFEKLLK